MGRVRDNACHGGVAVDQDVALSVAAGTRTCRRIVLAVLLVGLGLVFSSGARGAGFTITPGESVFSSGAGPFYWSFKSSSDANSYTGWVGYKLSSESTWHRCLGASSTISLTNLSDGTYSVEIADDVNEDNLAARGLFQSSLNTCGDPSIAPPGAVSQKTFTIDSTPPTVGTPSVTTSDKTVQVSVQASDTGTGVASYTWVFGDGAQDTTSNPYDQHTYLLNGSYAGQVIVTDHAGNQTTRAFTAVVTSPSSGGSTPSSGGSTPTTSLASSAAHGYAAYMIAHRISRHPRIKVRCTRVSRLTLHCELAWTTSGYSYAAAGRFWIFAGSSGRFYWSYDFRGTRILLSCRSKHPRSRSCVRAFRWSLR
jgi:hypothetical protein